MCIIFVAYQVHKQYPLILAANRDEFWQRPTQPAQFWPDAPHILGGRDLLAGGTWLGVSRQGRVAAVTNYRDPQQREAERSRGELVSRFLMTKEPAAYLRQVVEQRAAYNGFNLLAGSLTELYYYSNRLADNKAKPVLLTPGVYGLSNHLLDTPWFKVEKGKQALKGILAAKTLSPEHLFKLLTDRELAPDHLLPETGIGYELEKRHSPIFIQDATYGTRSSTIVLMSRQYVWFCERSYAPDYGRFVDRSFVFPLDHGVS